MNARCFILVLFATQIIYTKEESPVDQNKTAPTWMPRSDDHGINFDKVEVFKNYDESPSDHKDLRPKTRRTLSRDRRAAITKGNQTSKKIYEDYDINDLQLNKFKLMVSPDKFKTLNASHVRFLNRNLSSGSPIKVKEQSNYSDKAGNNTNKPAILPGLIPNINANNSITPISWVISPACPQKNESNYFFSAIFNKKPTVHILKTHSGTAPGDQTPKVVINDSSITMLVGKGTNDTYDKMNSFYATKTSNPIPSGDKKPPPGANINHEKPTIEDTLLKGISEFTMTIQNNSKPQNYVTLSKVGDSLTISGQIKTHGNEQPRAPAKQGHQTTVQLAPNLQADVSAKTPTLTITAQGTKDLGHIPLFLLENSLPKAPLPGITLNKAPTTPQQAITNVLNSEIGARSLFPAEFNQNFERPTKKETVANLKTQVETEVQSSDLLYELFKNITVTNVINEDLNRKLLDESQIHTQQNWQLIKSNTDILNVLMDKPKQNGSP